MRHLVVPAVIAFTAAALLGCGGGSSPPVDPADAGVDPNDPLPPPAPGEGFQMAMSVTAPAGEEIWKCQVSEIPSDDFTKVNHVKSVQTQGVHHMDIMALALVDIEVEPGLYDCQALYDETPALMDDGLFLYASQRAVQEITMPEHTVAQLPPRIKIMHEVHFVNTTDAAIEVFSKVNVYNYEGTVEANIWGGAIRDVNIEVPVNREHVEWTRCTMTEDVDVLFLSSHTHALAEKVEVRTFDGETVGDLIYTNTDWQSPTLMQMETPMHLAAGTGFEFQCHYLNPGPEVVRWGFASTDEMCQIAIVYTPGEATRKCEIVEEGVLPEPAPATP